MDTAAMSDPQPQNAQPQDQRSVREPVVPPGPLTAIGALVLVLAAALLLREVATLVVPVLFGLFLALVTWPLVGALERRGAGHMLALAVAIIVVIIVVLATFGVLALSVAELVIEVPKYQDKMAAQVAAIRDLLQGFGVSTDLEALLSLVSPGTLAGFARSFASAVSGAGIALFVLIITMLYALAVQHRSRSGRARPLVSATRS